MNIIQGIVNRVSNMPTPDMYEFFQNRTKQHIKRVRENLDRIATWYDFDKKEINHRKKTHDLSKFSVQEKIPYIFLTWYYKCKNENIPFSYPKGMERAIEDAIGHHGRVNSHHPEAHENITEMNSLDLAEMISDWAAMSQELGTSLREWADNHVGERWEFSKAQTNIIYNLIDLFPELK